MMKKILLEIKHSINKRIGNAIESISCRLYYHSKKNSWGHCLYAMNNMVSDYPFMHLLYSQLLVCQRVCLQNTVCLICK